jgi:hypothetical protein
MLELNLSLACNGDPRKIAEMRKQIEAEAAAAAGRVVDITAEVAPAVSPVDYPHAFTIRT